MAKTVTDSPSPEVGEGYRLDPEVVDAALEALESGQRERLLALVKDFHAADFADLLEQIKQDDRRRIVETFGHDLDPQILSELEEGVLNEVLGYIAPDVLVRAVSALDSDDAVHLLEDLDARQRREVLEALERPERVAVEESLRYPEDSAGRMMQRELVKAPPFWTVGQVIDFMRLESDLPQQFYEIVVVDPAHRPVGVVPLARIMGSRRQVALETIMNTELWPIRADENEEDVAYAFHQYRLVSAPVVDESGRLVGAITIDDAVGALDEQAEEDIHLLGGVGDEEITDSVSEIALRRFPWLLTNLATAILASLVISIFDDTIDQLVALAVLMPIVASMGGNAGTQSLTVAVRALATRDLTKTNAGRVVVRELLVGVANGVTFALIAGGVAYLWYGDATLGAVLGLAMVLNLVVAALAGILVPIGCERVGADPALASSAFVTTVTDVAGFFAFLGLAAWLLL